MEPKSQKKVLLLLSGGKDSPEALRRLLKKGYEVHGLCIDGVQGKEKIGAQAAADQYQIPLDIVSLSFFDEETWNPFKLVKRDLAMGFIAIKLAKKLGAMAIATGVKRTDIENPVLWWLAPFLLMGAVILKAFGLQLMYPVWEMGYQSKSLKKRTAALKKKAFYLGFALLPRPLRHLIYRKKIFEIPQNTPSSLTFELARSKEDLEAAFKLLHNAYVEQGFIQPQESGMRLILQHALPTTSILIAKSAGQVVGTISVMRDNPLGVPMEKAFDLSPLRVHGARVAELSCLAIHPEFRRKMGGSIFFPLTIFAALYSQKQFGTDVLVWNVYPYHADFYNGIFGSTHLAGRKTAVKDYLGAPATAIQLDFRTIYDFIQKNYRGAHPTKDLFTYSYKLEKPYFLFPKRRDGVINDPVMSPEMLRYFFLEKTQLLENLTELERQVVRRYYPLSSYTSLFGKVLPLPIDFRKKPRWDLKLPGKIMLKDGSRTIDIVILDASTDGFRAYLDQDIRFRSPEKATICLDSKEIAEVEAFPVWKTEDRIYGFKIKSANIHWKKVINNAAAELKKVAS